MSDDRTADNLLHILFAGAAGAAYTIPPELTAAARVLSVAIDLRKAAMERRFAAGSDRSVDRAADAVLEALVAGSSAPDIDSALGRAADEERAADLAEAVAIEVESRAHNASTALVDDLAETILIDHLRPALAATLEAVAKLAPSLAGVDPDDVEALLEAPKAVQDARRRLVTLADRRSAIYAAAARLRHWLGSPQHDDGAFLFYRNAAALWGRQWPTRTQAQARGNYPWPAGPLANLVWAASPAAGSWLPLPAEQDEALAEFLRATKPGTLMGGLTTGPRLPWYSKGTIQPSGEAIA